MSKARDALYDLKNQTEIGYKWEDLEFYITGKHPTKTPDLRLAIQETLDLLRDVYTEKKYDARKPEQLKLNLRYKS